MSDDTPTAEDLELLGIGEGASMEEIERGYRHERALYAEDSLATYALLDAEARTRHLAALEEAYRKVKLAYSASPPPVPPPPAPTSGSAAERQGEGATPADPPPPASAAPAGEPPEADLTAPGASLAALRAHRGMALAELARRTRIGRAYLEALEAEDYEALPALVYVRGFVQQVARELGSRRGAALAQAFAEKCKAARGE